MSELFDAGELFEPEGDDNPFLGIDGFDAFTLEPDPFDALEHEVLDSLGIDTFDSILITNNERTIENARGNRFESLKEAIIYLFDAGVLQFSGVVLDEDLFEVEIDSDTGRSQA